MSLCQFCGNQIVADNCQPDPAHWTPVCLVCQHTGRHEQTATEKLMAANLKAVYEALQTNEQIEAVVTVEEAQMSLRSRIQDQKHSRIRPDLEADAGEERERNYEPPCHSCNGTGQLLLRRCPDCREDD
jgi:hypothetical protein